MEYYYFHFEDKTQPPETWPKNKCTSQWLLTCPFDHHAYLVLGHNSTPCPLMANKRSDPKMEVIKMDEIINGVATMVGEKNWVKHSGNQLIAKECHAHTTCEHHATYRIDFIGQSLTNQKVPEHTGPPQALISTNKTPGEGQHPYNTMSM